MAVRQARSSPRILLLVLVAILIGGVRLLAGALERGAENVTQRRAGIGGAVLGNRLLLLGDFERLDRHLHLVGAAVEMDYPRIDLLAYRKALRPLLAAVPRQFGALDEGGEVGADDVHLEAAFLHFGHLAGDDRAL